MSKTKICSTRFLNLREFMNLWIFSTKSSVYMHRCGVLLFVFFPSKGTDNFKQILKRVSTPNWEILTQRNLSFVLFLCGFLEKSDLKYVSPPSTHSTKYTNAMQLGKPGYLFLKWFSYPLHLLQNSLWTQSRS